MPAEKAICPVEPGERKRVTFEVDGFRCAMLICSDAGIVGIYDELATERCDAVILLAAGAGNESFGLHQVELAKPEVLDRYSKTALTYVSPEGVKQSLRLNIAQVAVNQAGHDPATGYFATDRVQTRVQIKGSDPPSGRGDAPDTDTARAGPLGASTRIVVQRCRRQHAAND
jgi:hypothetical protein